MRHGAHTTRWPLYPTVFAQLGARRRELYVDDCVDEGSSVAAHYWLLLGHRCGATTTAENSSSIADGDGWAGGAPLRVVLGFLRRYLQGAREAPPARPANAREWAQLM